jgi:hypothetical protein
MDMLATILLVKGKKMDSSRSFATADPPLATSEAVSTSSSLLFESLGLNDSPHEGDQASFKEDNEGNQASSPKHLELNELSSAKGNENNQASSGENQNQEASLRTSFKQREAGAETRKAGGSSLTKYEQKIKASLPSSLFLRNEPILDNRGASDTKHRESSFSDEVALQRFDARPGALAALDQEHIDEEVLASSSSDTHHFLPLLC